LDSFLAAFLSRYNELQRENGQAEVGAQVFSVADCGVWACVLTERWPTTVRITELANFNEIEMGQRDRTQEAAARGQCAASFQMNPKKLGPDPSPTALAEQVWHGKLGSSLSAQPSPAAPEGIGATTPSEIADSLKKFRSVHPDPNKVAFIMMRFTSALAHTKIMEIIKESLSQHGIIAVRADEREYHEDLYWNIVTYLHGCNLGIAVFERIEMDEFNPNLSFEVGYLFALRKPVCLLKDKNLKGLHTDIVGKLYRPFDPQNAQGTIPTQIAQWIKDRIR
jgi:hypothetical protein